jgi:spoIIIJ-associated protein
VSEDGVSVEGAGETVGEAKWAAMQQLEALLPGLDRGAVTFQVVSEGERGLLGVGYTPARVLALAPPTAAADRVAPSSTAADAAVAKELLDRTIAALELSASTRIEEGEDEIRVTIGGPDVGVLIGRHGQTLDALQIIANAIARRSGDEPRRVVVDAAGYRDRRETTLRSLAREHAARAVALGERVPLEAMSGSERRIVHESLKDDPEVTTASEGVEPHRYVVIVPHRTAD